MIYETSQSEYTSRNKMEETTAKVLARLHSIKSILYKTMKKTSCASPSNHNVSHFNTTNIHSGTCTATNGDSAYNITSNETISSISPDSIDSGVSTLSDFSHNSLSSAMILLNRTMFAKGAAKSNDLRCDPSIINYFSHNLLTTHYSSFDFDEIDNGNLDETFCAQTPLAESSRQVPVSDSNDQTYTGEEEDDQQGPLTSTLIDKWYTVSKPYTATFREDLSVRKTELVQLLRSSHPHWIWVRNEKSEEGFIPTECLILS